MMKKYFKTYFEYIITYGIWLTMVVAWNFGYPQATPFLDVVAAIIFAMFTFITLRKFKILKGI